MPLITNLRAGKRDPSRVNLYLDGRFAFSLSLDEVVERGLKAGQALADELVTALSALSQEEKLFGKILNYLSYRPRSRREVRDRLRQYLRGHENSSAVIDRTLARLDRLGYLDDAAFAAWFVQSRMDNRPRSLRHLTSELSAKGISREIIRETLAEHADDEQAIRALIAKHKGKSPEQLTAFLARRGFSYDLIRSVLTNID